jgi:organic hydroperoxide reductase OsmC/OhrA
MRCSCDDISIEDSEVSHEDGIMKPLPHHYDVHLTGGPTGYAQVSGAGLPELRTAPPADYDGPGDAWSPEHLLLASVQTCFLFTLRAVARLSKVEFLSLDVDVGGTVARQDGVARFTEIVLRPKLTVPIGTDRERALRVLEKSETGCLVSASLSTPIRLEPEIQEASEPVDALSYDGT